MARFTEEKFMRQFRKQMTLAEKAAARERFTNMHDELDEMREKHEDMVSESRDKIKKKEMATADLRLDLKIGVLGDVECVRKFDWVLGEVSEVRVDTGEVYHTRKINDKDRQNYLPGTDMGGSSDGEKGPDKA